MHEATNIKVVLFLVKQPMIKNVYKVKDLRIRSVFHFKLLEKVIFPFQKKYIKSLPSNILLSPEALVEKYPLRIRLKSVDDPNDISFIDEEITKNRGLKMSFSIRNLVVFKSKIIHAHHEKGAYSFINLHPADTEIIRGLDGPFWTHYYNYPYTTTMHVIDKGIDTGGVIDHVSTPLDSLNSIADYPLCSAEKTSNMIFKHICFCSSSAAKKNVKYLKPNKSNSKYYATPTKEKVQEVLDRGISIIDPLASKKFILDNYANKIMAPKQYEELDIKLENTIREFDFIGN